MDGVSQRLEALRGRIERAKTDKAKAEANLEHATTEIEQITKELADKYQLKPDQLDSEIEALEKEILESLDRAEQIMAKAEGLS